MSRIILGLLLLGLLSACEPGAKKNPDTAQPQDSGRPNQACSFRVDTSSLARMAMTSYQYSIECKATEAEVFEMLESYN